MALPFLWIGLLCVLRWANAGILLADGVLTVRNRWHGRDLRAPVSSLTGSYLVRLPGDGKDRVRIVITARRCRPVMIDPRTWNQQKLGELWQHLPVPLLESGFLDWRGLRIRFPGVHRPWYLVHYRLFLALATLVCIAYIALVVNLPFLL